MPRYIFPAGTVTVTDGRPRALQFFRSPTATRPQTDLKRVESGYDTTPIANGVITTDESGNYPEFAGPDDLTSLWMQVVSGPGGRTKLDSTTAVSFSGPFAPLDSPALTGSPTAPTPAPGDNDSSVATTAFVEARALQGDVAHVHVDEHPPTPQRFRQAGDPDWTLGIQRMLDAGKTAAYIPPSSTPYDISAGLVQPRSMSLEVDPGATIRATAAIAGPMLSVGDLTGKWTDKHLVGGTWECNSLAAIGIHVKYHLNVVVEGMTIRNQTSHGLVVGDGGTPAASNEARVRDVKIDREVTGAVPSGSNGIWLTSTNDSHVSNSVAVGAQNGIRNGGSGNKLTECHAWGWGARLPANCFVDEGYNSEWIACRADSPSEKGWWMKGLGWRIIGGDVWNGDLGLDNVITGVHSDNASPTASIIGLGIIGISGHRVLTDCNLGPSSYLTAAGCFGAFVTNPNITTTETFRSIRSSGYLQPYAQSGGPKIHGGSGDPNTYVTGAAGDVYVNTAGSAGTWLYRCTGGTAWTAVL